MTNSTKASPGAIALLIVYAAALFVGTHIPHPQRPDAFTLQDKLLHLCAYAGFTVLALRAAFRPRPFASVMIAIFTSIVVFAAIDEWTQAWVPGRQPDFHDWLADLGGLMVGWAAFRVAKGVHSAAECNPRQGRPG